MPAKNYKPHPFLSRVLLILIFIAAASGAYLILPSPKNTPTKNINANNQTAIVQSSTPRQNLILEKKTDKQTPPLTKINAAAATIAILDKNYSIAIKQGMSVFDAMQFLFEKKEISFTAKNYAGMGEFIEEINGLKNDPQSGKYWIYYINGEPAKMGISNYLIKNNDLIKWNYEKSKF